MDLHLAGHTFAINTPEYQPLAEGGGIASASILTLELPAMPLRYLYSGWQSWSLTAWADVSHPVRPMRPRALHPLQTDPVYAQETRPHGSWYAAVELPDHQVLLVGALCLESHVMLDGRTLTGWVEDGTGEWFVACGPEDELFSAYAKLLASRLGSVTAQVAPRVWCSWYSFYTGISQERLLTVLADLHELPFDVFQVDDGWQVGIGDWEANAKFPAGMPFLASTIKATGRRPGLWLAPLLISPDSAVYHAHRDWLLHDERGALVSAGFNWGHSLFALDTTHPEALDWLRSLMTRVRAWGYDYIKLDFLYAGALPGLRHLDTPRETAFRQGLQIIRQALGDAYFLSCGAPILPSLGLCDALRLGPDVASYWVSERDDNLLMNFAAPGARNALRTTLNRLWLAPLVHPDPDVVYFRTRNNDLDLAQRSLLQDLSQVCAFKATSDLPSWLEGSERQALHQFLEQTPPVEKIGPACYRIGERVVDFNPHIALPASPGPVTNLLGALLGSLANFRPLLAAAEKLTQRRHKRAIARQTT